MLSSQIDIQENDIFRRSPKLLSALLKDHTLSTEDCQVNIFWATNNYANRGDGYQSGWKPHNQPIKVSTVMSGRATMSSANY